MGWQLLAFPLRSPDRLSCQAQLWMLLCSEEWAQGGTLSCLEAQQQKWIPGALIPVLPVGSSTIKLVGTHEQRLYMVPSRGNAPVVTPLCCVCCFLSASGSA